MTVPDRPHIPHEPTGAAQRGALEARIRAVRRRIVGGSLLGTALFTVLAGYQTLSKTTVADAADEDADTAVVAEVVPATATAPLFADQGGVAVTTPTAAATVAPTATPAPTATVTASDVIGPISTPVRANKAATPTATATATPGTTPTAAATTAIAAANAAPTGAATAAPTPTATATKAATKRSKTSSS